MVKFEIGGHPVVEIRKKNEGGRRDSIKRRIRSDRPQHFNWGNTEPRLVVTSDTNDFDHEVLAHFQEEGFQIWYLPYSGDRAAYNNQLQHLADPLETGEQYAIVAYGSAATLCLEACQQAMPKLCAVVAYYPTSIPSASDGYPPALNLQIHLAASQKFGTREPSHRYPDTIPGFAESDLEEYDQIAAHLAWSRTLATLRRGFGIDVDLEPIKDNHAAMTLQMETDDADEIMENMIQQPYITNVPTMTGGIGSKEVYRFYRDFFIPGSPPSLRTKLLSRTVGSDRIVDEMLVTFRHTHEMPWILPGVPPTDKEVEVVIVSVVCIRGSKLYHEHVHWDQATVLVQIGMLDPKLVPGTFKTAQEGREKEVKRLPVCGREAARKLVDEEHGKSNELIPNW